MRIVFITGISVLSFLAYLRNESQLQETKITVCHASIDLHNMALMATDPAFQQLHANPLPFTYTGAGEMITFPTPDGQPANGFLLKAKQPSNKWLLVYQEWWGLNDNIKHQAEAFYNDLKNVNVLAVDMYDGKVTADRAEAGKLMAAANKERLTNIQKGAITYVGSKAEIGSIGWCFGGMLSLQSALLEGKQAKACVIYYGRPEQDVEKLKTLQTDVLGIFGSRDKGINPETVKQFEESMANAGKKVTVKMYEADHGFANPSNPIYDKEATADAYARSLAYLKEKLKA